MPKNQSPFKFIAVFFIALFCLSASAQTNEIRTTLDLTDRALDVRIEIPAGDLDKIAFTISDWAGETNYAENIYRVVAKDKNGNALRVEKREPRTWIVDNAKKAFELSYTVVSQKDSFIGGGARSHFHPSIFRDYAFLWGATFLLMPDDEALGKLPARLRINPHEYKQVYTNFEGGVDSFKALEDFFLAAGDYRVAEKTIGGRRVKFLLRGAAWKFTDEEFTKTVAGIIEAQVKYMGFSPSNADLLITLTEGSPASKGGTVVKNVISVYPNPQDDLRNFDTLKLIAHEHFHFWNGDYFKPAAGRKEGYYKWLSEGFTEYYAGLTLYRENLLTEKEFAAWLNNLLLDYRTNPHAANATAEILAEKYWESRDYNRLPYVKGALLGFLTDLQVRQKSAGQKQIDDLMRLWMSMTDRAKGYTDALLLANFDALTQNSNQQFYADFMLGARPLPVAEVLKNSGINAVETPKDIFDLGFATENGKLERGAKIKEITTPSATDAGLKPGDELRGFSVRYGEPQTLASVTVLRGGETLQFKYYPKKTVNVVQISENAVIPK